MVAADDNPGDVLSFTFQSLPSWLSNSDGAVSVDPLLTDAPGTTSLTLRVQDDNSAADTSELFVDVSFDIEILEINQAPQQVSNLCTGLQIRQGASTTCAVTYSDPNSGDSLTYSLEVNPAWVTITGGTLNIDPLTSTPFALYSITVRATDNNSVGHPSVLFTEETFNIEVLETNFAPTLNSEDCSSLQVYQTESGGCTVAIDDENGADTLTYSFLS